MGMLRLSARTSGVAWSRERTENRTFAEGNHQQDDTLLDGLETWVTRASHARQAKQPLVFSQTL